METPYFTFFSLGPSKGVPKQSSSRGPAPEPRSVENCNTHAFGAVRGPWPAPLWGSISGHPFFHSETPCREIGIARSALLGVPFRGHLITQPVPQTRTCFEARFSTHAVTGPFQGFQGWLQLGVPGGMGWGWVVGRWGWGWGGRGRVGIGAELVQGRGRGRGGGGGGGVGDAHPLPLPPDPLILTFVASFDPPFPCHIPILSDSWVYDTWIHESWPPEAPLGSG